MEKVMKSYDKEFMRMAMLKHEETFREQVYELHRVYQVQKMLMDRAGHTQKQPKQLQHQRQLQDRFLVDHQIKQAFTITTTNQTQATQRDNDSKSKGINMISMGIERMDNSNQVGLRLTDAQEHIAESTSNVKMLDEGEVELTLSLGPSRRRKTGESDSNQSLSSSSTGSSQTKKTSSKNCSSITRGDQFGWGEPSSNFSNGPQNNPPWMFQTLSLKLS